MSAPKTPTNITLEKSTSDRVQPRAQTPAIGLPVYQITLLLSLYLAQGLPVGFLTQALPAILRKNNVSLAAIGGFGLLMAPWGLKFLWAPLVDRYYSALWGKSRSWIIPSQILVVLLLGILVFLEPSQLASPVMLLGFFIVLFLINLMGATQDIATDGLAVRLLQKNHQQWGNAIQVLGSRLGFIVGGGAVLLLLDLWSWPIVFALLTFLVFLNGLPVLFFKEPTFFKELAVKESACEESTVVNQHTGFKHAKRAAQDEVNTHQRVNSVNSNNSSLQSLSDYNPQQGLEQALTSSVTIDTPVLSRIKKPQQWVAFFAREFAYFWRNQHMRAWFLVLLTFKLGDSLSGAMVKPMMVDMGFSLGNIGLMASMLGSVASLIGALLAAWCMRYMTRGGALWWFNGLQILSFALYAAIAWQFEYLQVALPWQVYSVNAFEQFAGAMALVAMLTIIMDYSRKQHAGSDFTFQVSVLAMTGGIVHIFSGFLAQKLGYGFHFGFCVALAVVCVWPIMAWKRVKDLADFNK